MEVLHAFAATLKNEIDVLCSKQQQAFDALSREETRWCVSSSLLDKDGLRERRKACSSRSVNLSVNVFLSP
jgi:hypothetical protein